MKGFSFLALVGYGPSRAIVSHGLTGGDPDSAVIRAACVESEVYPHPETAGEAFENAVLASAALDGATATSEALTDAETESEALTDAKATGEVVGPCE